ncbi:MAG: pyrroline-5-carboxylate reductase [bacterium]
MQTPAPIPGSMDVRHARLVILGCGNMGSAIARGVLDAGVLAPSRLVLVDAQRDKLEPFAVRGVAVASGLGEVRVGSADVLLLAIKPQGLASTVGVISECVASGAGMISIMAGITLARLERELETPRVVRAMPNLPAGIGQGATAVAWGSGADAGLRRFAMEVFGAVGPVVVPIAEALMDAFTAIAGSGPAYVFYLGEALVKSAAEQGFSDAEARLIVRQVLIGSAGLLAGDGREFGVLRQAVTSAGGVTQSACNELDAAGVMRAWSRAIAAGTLRGGELSGA